MGVIELNNQVVWLAVALLAVVIGFQLYYFFLRRSAGRLLADAEEKASRIASDAKRESEDRLREGELQAKEKLLQARNEFEKVSRKRRGGSRASSGVWRRKRTTSTSGWMS